MPPSSRNIHRFSSFVAAIFLALLCLVAPGIASAQEETAAPKSFPTLGNVIPMASQATTSIAKAESELQQAAKLGGILEKLDKQVEYLNNLETQYPDWEEIDSWLLNRLVAARINYKDLKEQREPQLKSLYEQINTVILLRDHWERERSWWQEWQTELLKVDVKLPQETFHRVIADIDELLRKITRVGDELVKAQQKYSPGQEIIVKRLNLINQTLDSLRLDSFRRNTFSIFEADYYRQFDRELWTSFTNQLNSVVQLPQSFLKRHGWIIAVQTLGSIITFVLLILRKRRSKLLTEEWQFLYSRPLAGAIFIPLSATSLFADLFGNSPPIFRLLIIVTIAVSGVRLLNPLYQQPLIRQVIRTIAIFYLLTSALLVFGLPTPAMQLYLLLLCAAALPICWRLIRDRREELQKLLLATYLILVVALIGLIAAMLGFTTLTINLIDATLGSFILIILLKMVLLLADGGITALMSAEWVKSRKFFQTLGVDEATDKLQNMLRIFILANAALYFLVIWNIFDDLIEARDYLLNFEYSIGEFTLSVNMVVMVVIVLYLTTQISWMIQAFVDSQIMTPRKMDRGVKESLNRLAHYALFSIGFLIAVSMAGLDLQKFTILAGALGVGIGFGLQNIVNNFVSGLILLFERPVKVGDVINIDQDWGTITKIGLRSTIFETLDRSEIIVPNADLISQKVTNWTFSSKVVRVTLPVGVAYGSPLEKVLGILNRAAREHPEILKYPETSAIFDGFGNSSIDFTLRFWIQNVDQRLRIRTEVAVIIDRLFREQEITIPFPQQDLHLRSIEGDLQPLFGKRPAPLAPSPMPAPEATAEADGGSAAEETEKTE